MAAPSSEGFAGGGRVALTGAGEPVSATLAGWGRPLLTLDDAMSTLRGAGALSATVFFFTVSAPLKNAADANKRGSWMNIREYRRSGRGSSAA